MRNKNSAKINLAFVIVLVLLCFLTKEMRPVEAVLIITNAILIYTNLITGDDDK